MMNKNEWKKVKLGDITIQIRGVTYKKSDVCEKETENFIPLLRANNIKDSKIIYNDVVFVNQNNVSENQILRKNDILICTSSGSLNLVGKAGQINKNENISFGAFCKVIRILDENRLNPLYLNYFFQSNYYKQNIKKIAQGANINNLKNGDIDNLEIILYSLEKQKYIGNILNDLSNILNKRKEQLFELEKLVKFQFLKMTGDLITNEKKWNFEIFKNICDIRDGTHDSPKYIKNGYPLITSKNITNGYLDFNNINYISKEDFDKINKRSKVDKGDIIMPMIGTIGKPLIINENIEFAIKNVALIKFNNSSYNNLFIKELLNSDYFYYIIKKNNRGGTQKFISLGDIRNILIPCIPIELQNKFAEFVKQVDKSKVELQKSIDETQLLFDSLMDRYFG